MKLQHISSSPRCTPTNGSFIEHKFLSIKTKSVKIFGFMHRLSKPPNVSLRFTEHNVSKSKVLFIFISLTRKNKLDFLKDGLMRWKGFILLSELLLFQLNIWQPAFCSIFKQSYGCWLCFGFHFYEGSSVIGRTTFFVITDNNRQPLLKEQLVERFCCHWVSIYYSHPTKLKKRFKACALFPLSLTLSLWTIPSTLGFFSSCILYLWVRHKMQTPTFPRWLPDLSACVVRNRLNKRKKEPVSPYIRM